MDKEDKNKIDQIIMNPSLFASSEANIILTTGQLTSCTTIMSTFCIQIIGACPFFAKGPQIFQFDFHRTPLRCKYDAQENATITKLRHIFKFYI